MVDRELVVELETGKVRPATAEAPLLTSAPRNWPGIRVERLRLREVEADHICCLNHVVFLQINTPAKLEWAGDLPKKSASFLPGQISFLPACLPFSARARDAGEFLTVSLEPAFLACAASDYGALESVNLKPVLAEEDPLMRELLGSFQAELENRRGNGELYVQSLATMLAVHLVQKYSATTHPRREVKGGLGREQLLRTSAYIQERLASPISLAELAALNGISPFHFTRLFKRSTGITPYEYVTRSRVEKARTLLLQSHANITEVALQVGFYDQSHFSRHFKRICGATPAAFFRAHRRRKIVL